MKEYCVDLEIAKQLKENGFPVNESLNTDLYYKSLQKYVLKYNKNIDDYFISIKITTDELLKELPNEIMGYVLEIIRYQDGTIEADYTRNLQYEDGVEYLIKSKKLFYKLSSSLAHLWLDIKKEGYIK